MGIHKKRGPGMAGDDAKRSPKIAAKRPRPHLSEVTPQSVAVAKRMVRDRFRRTQFFASSLFADPAWDMMLDIFIAEAEGRATPVMNLCLSSHVPETTTLRWVRTLEHAGIFIREKDEHDQRRVLVRLSPEAAKAMAQYFRDQA